MIQVNKVTNGATIIKKGDKIMKCAACGGDMIEKNGDLDLRIHEKLYIVRNINYEECSKCGETVIKPGASERIYNKIKNHNYIKEMMEIPVIQGVMA